MWVNGDNFATGKQVDAWRCGWSARLPNMEFVGADDALVTQDFGTAVDGCEAPWHKAQFTLVYDSARVSEPPTSMAGVLRWAKAHPGRFTYPAPPDFTGSVFLREALYSTAGGADSIPAQFDRAAFDRVTPPLWAALRDVAPSLWRQGRTYPRDSVALDRLYADGEVDLTMTYGPATFTRLVADGTFPKTTRVLPLTEGTIGNASFLAIPAAAGDPQGAMVVADLALSPAQQALKADPAHLGTVHGPRHRPAERVRPGPFRRAAGLGRRAAVRRPLPQRQPRAAPRRGSRGSTKAGDGPCSVRGRDPPTRPPPKPAPSASPDTAGPAWWRRRSSSSWW